MSAFHALLFFNFILVALGDGYIVNPGPKVIATRGHPSPLPKSWLSQSTYLRLIPEKFEFGPVKKFDCPILANATARYTKIIRGMAKPRTARKGVEESLENEVEFQGDLRGMSILLESPCEEYPHLSMNESYSLNISQSGSTLTSSSIWGILRGLETFSQLIYRATPDQTLLVNETCITDEPRFPHRGLMLDTSRHFISPGIIKQILDGMSYSKLNVFHWHLVDDQSFPFVSLMFPELSEKGAYKPEFVYEPDTVQEIIEFARLRGIRVVPELDTPGHTRSWGVSHLELLTKCHGKFEGAYGPMDPTKNNTFRFIRTLFREVASVFRDKFFHIGADEVDFECWKSNAEIVEYMAKRGYGADFKQLQNEFVGRVTQIVEDMDGAPVMWEEAFNANLSKAAIVHVWKRSEPMAVMKAVTESGHRAILSTGWYLDRLMDHATVADFMKVDPRGFKGSAAQMRLVLGGEACMWSELVDDDNVLQRIFSRVAAPAERLWAHDFTQMSYAFQRFEEHNCRLRSRGLKTEMPNGPGFC